MERINIINSLIQKFDYKSYLEIGVSVGHTFRNVNCIKKVGVDPNGNPNYKMTSDGFFKINKDKFDIIFIDGLHIKGQVETDILNSLDILNENGIIMVHDCNPPNEKLQTDISPKGGGPWWGSVWKAWASLRQKISDHEFIVVDTDCGCGIIRKGHNELLEKTENLDWNYLDQNRNRILNLITVEEFKNKFNL